MNEEIRTMEEIENEIVGIINEPTEVETSGNGILGKVILSALVLGGAGVAAWFIKTKDERKAKKIEKEIKDLEANGFIVRKLAEGNELPEVEDEIEEDVE